MPFLVTPFVQSYLRLGTNPGDRESVRLGKAQLMGSASLGSVGMFVLGSIYLSYDEPMAGFVFVGCGMLMTINVGTFALAHRSLEFAFTTQAILTFLTALLVVFALGSFANSSGILLWALFFVLLGGPYAQFWFVMFMLSLIATILVQPWPRDSINVSPFVVSLLWVINLSGVSGVLLALYRYAVGQRNIAYRLLRGEREKAEILLLNILPQEVAAILKDQPRTIAEHFDGASILFADVVNFTPLSAQMTPVELVELLNEVFSDFDVLVEKYGLEKIKTIGDCYMVAAGVPRTRPDHAQTLAQLALDMQAYIAAREFHGRKLAIRIGLNSGQW